MSVPEHEPLQRPLPDHIADLLSSPVVEAIDSYFRAHYRAALATVRGDPAGIAATLDTERQGLSAYLALVVERLDSRNAHVLVEAYKQLDALNERVRNLEALMRTGDDTDDPTGHDAGRLT